MATPQELTALKAFHSAASEVARVFDDHSPWGGAATEIARNVGRDLERMTGTYTIEIPAGHRARFSDGLRIYAENIADVLATEPENTAYDVSAEARAFLDSLRTADKAAPAGEWEITVETVLEQSVLAEVLKECVNEEIRTISCEKIVDRRRREEFDEEVESVDYWFNLLGQIAPVKGAVG
jgi:hypothetical protein